jgi:hypothetical protein
MRKYDFLVAVSVVTDLPFPVYGNSGMGDLCVMGGDLQLSMGPNTNSTCFYSSQDLLKVLLATRLPTP